MGTGGSSGEGRSEGENMVGADSNRGAFSRQCGNLEQ